MSCARSPEVKFSTVDVQSAAGAAERRAVEDEPTDSYSIPSAFSSVQSQLVDVIEAGVAIDESCSQAMASMYSGVGMWHGTSLMISSRYVKRDDALGAAVFVPPMAIPCGC